MTLSYFLSEVLRVKTYGVLMKNFSVSCGLADWLSFRKISSVVHMIL